MGKPRGKVLAVGVLLAGLMGVAGFLRGRPPEEVLLFVLVPAAGEGAEVEDAAGPCPRQSQIAALDLHRPQEPKQLTGEFFSACAPAVSYDGRRFLFAGRRPEAEPQQIWEMEVDGSGLRQVTRGMSDCADPCYLPDGRIAFSGAVPEQGGVRFLFTCAQDGSQFERITFGEGYDVKPTVLPDGRILFMRMSDEKASVPMTVNPDGTGLQRFYGEVPARGRILSQRPPEARTYGLYEFDLVSYGAGQLLYSDADVDAIDPVLAASRPRPRALTSVVDEVKQTGWLLCLNVYLSQLPEVASLRPGDVKQVQVAAQGRALGEAAVEEDGSFYVEVPADTPLRLRLLGREGRVVASLEREIWVRPNESRGCIGCHEDPALSPENRVPLSVTKPPVFIAPSSEGENGGYDERQE